MRGCSCGTGGSGTGTARFDQRAPTLAFTLDGYTLCQIAERLGGEYMFVWD
jgi:hypothetical protein